MAALLASTPPTYVDPKAAILYGGGNSAITDEQIKAYINTPGVTANDVMAKALETGVNTSQISSAMGATPGYTSTDIDKYLMSQGVSKEQTPQQYALPDAAKTPEPVTYQPITVTPTETVQGQMSGILNDKTSPLMVQANTMGNSYSNKRGLLNSSIGASAAESSMINAAMPIASQDASTNFAAKQQNAQGALTADTFNADVTSRTNMFNTGAAKDIYTANMDTQNKLAIANVQAMANDTGVMGDLGKSALAAYTQIITDQTMSPEVKTASINKVYSDLQGMLSLIPSIDAAGLATTFDTPVAQANVSTAGTAGGSSTTPASGTAVSITTGKPVGDINQFGYQPEPAVMTNVIAYEKATGTKINPATVVPQALIEDLRYGPSTMNFGESYVGTDGNMHKRNWQAYDYNALMKQYGVKSQGELFDAMFVAVQPPGTMRADAPLFYVYR